MQIFLAKASLGNHKMRDNGSNDLDSHKANGHVEYEAHPEIGAFQNNETDVANDGRKIMFLEKAKLCLENKDFVNAHKNSLKALVLDNKYFDGWYYCALASFSLSKAESDNQLCSNNINETLEELEECRKLKPGDPNMWAMFGDVYAYQNEYYRAVAAFSMSIWTDTKPNPDVILSRCKTSFALKNYNVALNDANSVLKIRNNDFDALHLKAESLHKLKVKFTKESASCFLALHKLKPDVVDIKERLIDQYMCLREYEKALELCHNIGKDEPTLSNKNVGIMLEQKVCMEVFSAIESDKTMNADQFNPDDISQQIRNRDSSYYKLVSIDDTDFYADESDNDEAMRISEYNTVKTSNLNSHGGFNGNLSAGNQRPFVNFKYCETHSLTFALAQISIRAGTQMLLKSEIQPA
ncbi:hypothetical protein Ddc_00025 [Ditylenchus destructor]|nr:hypothetical protein Ddc_00025 [Ditylenchus destructor]